MEKEEVIRLIEKMDGWLSTVEMGLLYDLAKNCKGNGIIVEIGSWKGKSTICLSKGSKRGNQVKIYAIDPHTGDSKQRKRFGKVWTFEEFERNIKSVEDDDVVIPIVKTSEEAAKNFKEPVELIFVDGAHEYDLVKLDFNLWFPKVIEGGIMAFHDTTGRFGPKKVAEEMVYKSKYFRNVSFADSITFAEKVKQNTIKDRLKNRYVLLLKHIYELAINLPLPRPINIIGRKLLRLIK